MTQLLSAAGPASPAGEDRFPVGSRERPDPAGVVLRGGAAGYVRGYSERFGEAPPCFVGMRGIGHAAAAASGADHCGRPAVAEVYGLSMCGVHGEEAATGALEEIAGDLDDELGRRLGTFGRPPSPHVEAALRSGLRSLGDEAREAARSPESGLLEAFPLDRGRADRESVAYAEDPASEYRPDRQPPFDALMADRMLLHRHMRLAFEAGATWLVEALEREREEVAAQAAYALALEVEAGLRPAPGRGEAGGDR